MQRAGGVDAQRPVSWYKRGGRAHPRQQSHHIEQRDSIQGAHLPGEAREQPCDRGRGRYAGRRACQNQQRAWPQQQAAPIPRAMQAAAPAVNPGFLRMLRAA